jgi:hypothetical protein
MYTLDQLAHFDHCLFPGSFRDDLVAAGMDYYDADTIMHWIMHQRDLGRSVGIVQVYQEFICTMVDKEEAELYNTIFEKVLANFFAKV